MCCQKSGSGSPAKLKLMSALLECLSLNHIDRRHNAGPHSHLAGAQAPIASDTIHQDAASSSDSSTVHLPDATSVAIANRQFVNGLDVLGRDFENAGAESEARYRVVTDTGVGVSLSATAGLLAWGLRGGALFASLMSSTPIVEQY